MWSLAGGGVLRRVLRRVLGREALEGHRRQKYLGCERVLHFVGHEVAAQIKLQNAERSCFQKSLMSLIQKRPDVHKIILSRKLLCSRGQVSIFEDLLLICTVFLILGPFWGGEGKKPNLADKNVMDTWTFLINFSACNSGAGNSCADFMGTWHFWFFLLENAHAHRIPRLVGGGRGLEGGGGSANFIFMGDVKSQKGGCEVTGRRK